jgi:hypothetical protein
LAIHWYIANCPFVSKLPLNPSDTLANVRYSSKGSSSPKASRISLLWEDYLAYFGLDKYNYLAYKYKRLIPGEGKKR